MVRHQVFQAISNHPMTTSSFVTGVNRLYYASVLLPLSFLFSDFYPIPLPFVFVPILKILLHFDDGEWRRRHGWSLLPPINGPPLKSVSLTVDSLPWHHISRR